MSRLILTYPLSDGRIIEIPAADLRGLRDDLNELLPPEPAMPSGFATTNPLALYQTMTPKVPPQDPPTPPGEPLS